MTGAETATEAEPLNGELLGTGEERHVPRLESVPKQKLTLVVSPPGFTDPLIVAVVSVVFVAAKVVAARTDCVVKFKMLPSTSLVSAARAPKDAPDGE